MAYTINAYNSQKVYTCDHCGETIDHETNHLRQDFGRDWCDTCHADERARITAQHLNA